MLKIIKTLLFPKFCFGCKKYGRYLCQSCRTKLKPTRGDICYYCGKKSYFGLTHPGCRRRGGLDGLSSFFYYDGLTKRIITTIKYQLVTEAVRELMATLPEGKIKELQFYKKLDTDLIIIPVPLHPARLRRRGFNQSRLYARFFSDRLSLPLGVDVVTRIKNTRPQVELKNAQERYLNMIGAFQVDENVNLKNKSIIVVDDVWTTGATIKELGRTLKKAGASRVYALTIARVYSR